MVDNSTDKHWETFGLKDPYYGVLTDERYKSKNLNSEAKTSFFNSGEEDIEKVFSFIRKHIHADFQPKNVLDFGCGVGRLLLPLAARAEKVTGMDVSDSMLKEAKKNCADNSITNIVLLKSDDSLSNLDGMFDFIHSYIVFQHIPVKRGEKILDGLLDRLANNGIGAFHFTFSIVKEPSSLRKLFHAFTRCVPWYCVIRRLFLGIPLNEPEMQMNCYNVNRLLKILQKKGIKNIYSQILRHGKFIGLFLYFRKEG